VSSLRCLTAALLPRRENWGGWLGEGTMRSYYKLLFVPLWSFVLFGIRAADTTVGLGKVPTDRTSIVPLYTSNTLVWICLKTQILIFCLIWQLSKLTMGLSGFLKGEIFPGGAGFCFRAGCTSCCPDISAKWYARQQGCGPGLHVSVSGGERLGLVSVSSFYVSCPSLPERASLYNVQITGNTSWADSARDAMKEQCREEAQKNTTLPRHLVDQVVNSMCINDCSNHGQCVNGTIWLLTY